MFVDGKELFKSFRYDNDILFFGFFLKILFIHLRHRDREHEQGERQREKEKQAPC